MVNEKIKHLRNRASFGLSPLEKGERDVAGWVRASSRSQSITIVDKIRLREELNKSGNGGDTMRANAGNPVRENMKAVVAKAREQILDLNNAWMGQLTNSSFILREKMTLFWHDHFACRVRVPYLAQQQNNTLREHALGSFHDLLLGVSKDPGMLQFLNNQQNKKNSPNENFAREVLELFTLGHGNYAEADIKNAARAFTGWTFNPMSGKFFFREKVHDAGVKNFKGKSGNFSGEDILTIILEDQHAARFVTEKIWQYFVSVELKDDDIIHSLAQQFFRSGYDIHKLLLSIFESDWFYKDRFRGNRIKSPVELIAGIMIQTSGKFEEPNATLFIQRALSQVLFYPPNVGGWPTGKEWIDSSSLTFRMSLPGTMLKNTETNIEAKDDGDVNNAANLARTKKFSFTVDWPQLANTFLKKSADETLDALEYYLLPRPTSTANRNIVRTYSGKSVNDPEFIKKAFIGFMSLPEYQLS